MGVLGDVGQRLGDQVVRGRLDGLRQPLIGDLLDLDRHGRPAGEHLDRGAQAVIAEHGRVQAAGELAQLGQREGELLGGRREDRPGRRRIGFEPRQRDPQRQRQRDQALLGAVVKVALEPAPLDVAGGDDPRPRRGELLEPGRGARR